jgi:ABC-type transporter MlaC component
MSLCYDFQKWTMLSLALVAISLSAGLLQVVHGQTNETAKTKVDKLIEDTKNENAIEESYRAELIQRMQNTTCLNTNLEGIGTVPVNTSILKTSELEGILKTCVREGLIK